MLQVYITLESFHKLLMNRYLEWEHIAEKLQPDEEYHVSFYVNKKHLSSWWSDQCTSIGRITLSAKALSKIFGK